MGVNDGNGGSTSIPQNQPGAAVDDDLIVDLEPVEDGVPEPGDDDIEEGQSGDPNIESSTLPDDLVEEETREVLQNGSQGSAEERRSSRASERASDGNHEAYQRAIAAEERARSVEASAIWREAQARAAVAEQQANTARVALDTLNTRMESAYDQLARARENGDAQAEVQVQRAIQEMTQLRMQIEATRANIGDPRVILAQGQQQAQQILNAPVPGKRVGAGIQARHPLAERWAQSNAGWMRQNAAANNFVIKQSQSLTNDGWDPNSPGFYAELSKRVKTAFPTLNVSVIQAQRKSAQRGAVKSPVAPASSSSGMRSGNIQAGNKQRYTLTAQDQGAMRRMNLDPANPKHRYHFAKSRMDSASRSRS